MLEGSVLRITCGPRYGAVVFGNSKTNKERRSDVHDGRTYGPGREGKKSFQRK